MSQAPGSELGERVWVVMGGGGLKGLCHLGAWKAIREAGIEPAGVVGTSIGSLIACYLGFGESLEALEDLARSLTPRDIVRLNRRVAWINGVRQPSVLRGDVLRDFFEDVLAGHTWDDLQIPVQVNAVSLSSGECVWFGPGGRTDVPVLDAVQASSALPVLLPPVRVGGELMVDGGVVDMLGLDRAADRGASGVIGVDAGARGPVDGDQVVAHGMVGIQQRLFGIMSSQRRLRKLSEWSRLPLRVIRPQLDGYEIFDFKHIGYFIDEGYRAAKAVLNGG